MSFKQNPAASDGKRKFLPQEILDVLDKARGGRTDTASLIRSRAHSLGVDMSPFTDSRSLRSTFLLLAAFSHV